MQTPVYGKRARALQRLMEGGFEACLVTARNDILYYTGFDIRDDAGFLIMPGRGEPELFLSPLMNEAESLRTARVSFMTGPDGLLRRLKSFRRTGFDETTLSSGSYLKLRKAGPMVPASRTIKEPRMIKDAGEVESMRASVGVVRRVLKGLPVKGTEARLAEGIESRIGRLGAQVTFPAIVASGRNSAYIHYTPRPVRMGRPLVVDLGASLAGYCSDITRCLFYRSDGRQSRVYGDVNGMQAEVIDAAREGIPFDDLQAMYEKSMQKGGYKVLHSIGHGVGLNVHERPGRGDVLRKGMVMTVEPGVYLKGFGGVRLEDMILIRKGKPEVLSRDVRLG
jgi:Xaa-Pro aminopeptidase